jgi:hypothetical protein
MLVGPPFHPCDRRRGAELMVSRNSIEIHRDANVPAAMTVNSMAVLYAEVRQFLFAAEFILSVFHKKDDIAAGRCDSGLSCRTNNLPNGRIPLKSQEVNVLAAFTLNEHFDFL